MKFCHKCGAQCEDGAKFCKQHMEIRIIMETRINMAARQAA